MSKLPIKKRPIEERREYIRQKVKEHRLRKGPLQKRFFCFESKGIKFVFKKKPDAVNRIRAIHVDEITDNHIICY